MALFLPAARALPEGRPEPQVVQPLLDSVGKERMLLPTPTARSLVDRVYEWLTGKWPTERIDDDWLAEEIDCHFNLVGEDHVDPDSTSEQLRFLKAVKYGTCVARERMTYIFEEMTTPQFAPDSLVHLKILSRPAISTRRRQSDGSYWNAPKTRIAKSVIILRPSSEEEGVMVAAAATPHGEAPRGEALLPP